MQVDHFLKRVNDDNYRDVLQPAVKMILNKRHIVFTGIGTSGTLGLYGNRYFANMELNAYSLADPFAPIPPRGLENTLVIILSVSGETEQMIEQPSPSSATVRKCSALPMMKIPPLPAWRITTFPIICQKSAVPWKIM